ncbi:hypothetical protein HPP92_007161, partial [Vanilla planifolia]
KLQTLLVQTHWVLQKMHCWRKLVKSMIKLHNFVPLFMMVFTIGQLLYLTEQKYEAEL